MEFVCVQASALCLALDGSYLYDKKQQKQHHRTNGGGTHNTKKFAVCLYGSFVVSAPRLIVEWAVQSHSDGT